MTGMTTLPKTQPNHQANHAINIKSQPKHNPNTQITPKKIKTYKRTPTNQHSPQNLHTAFKATINPQQNPSPLTNNHIKIQIPREDYIYQQPSHSPLLDTETDRNNYQFYLKKYIA